MVLPSSLPGAGLGLFAARDFPRGGVRLPGGPYKGRLLTHAQLARLRDFSYCMLLPGGNPKAAALDAKACRRHNPLRYVNGAKTAQQARRVNVKMSCRRGGEVHFHTIRPVRAGTEFIVDYGASYWVGMEHNARLAELQKAVREARARVQAAASPQRRAALRAARDALEDFVENDGDEEEEE